MCYRYAQRWKGKYEYNEEINKNIKVIQIEF
jgi:hypothetical protein